MANRFANPDDVFYDASGVIASGGTLQFYASGTTTPLNTYSNQGLTIANTNPVTLDSSGKVPSNIDIFLQNLAYSVVFKDQLGNTVWTKDPVYASDYSTVAQFQTGNGSPNGTFAGTAGTPTIPASVYWDATNLILYVCTTTGTSTTAVWTAINASTAAAVVPAPQGRLTLTSGEPAARTDTTTTAVIYTPYVGNTVPIYNGTGFTPLAFSELTLTLVGSHAANTIYDVFAFNNSGVVTVVTGPAWSNSSAGAGTRGSGAGTSQITRINGLLVNAVAITAARNGSTTYSIAANQATFLGSIFIDSSNGQISCLPIYGQNRKWGVWNQYNRLPITLRGGDPSSTWTYGTIAWRPSNNSSSNKLTAFSGNSEELTTITFNQITSQQNLEFEIGVGINSTSAPTAFIATAGSTALLNLQQIVTYTIAAPSGFGINNIQSLESVESFISGTPSATLFGTENAMELKAIWNG